MFLLVRFVVVVAAVFGAVLGAGGAVIWALDQVVPEPGKEKEEGGAAPEDESPVYTDARDLAEAVGCDPGLPFDPGNGVADDGVEHPATGAVRCNAGDDALFVLVYETAADRQGSLETGEVQTNLCSFEEVPAFAALVGANWRVSTPDGDEAAERASEALGGVGTIEELSCQFVS